MGLTPNRQIHSIDFFINFTKLRYLNYNHYTNFQQTTFPHYSDKSGNLTSIIIKTS